MIESRKNYRILVMAILLAGICFLTYYFHAIFKTGRVFTHFFYIPIILAALWWRKKGLTVATFLAGLLILNHIFVRGETATPNDYLQALMFIVIAAVIATLSAMIAKAQQKAAHFNAVLSAIRNVNQLIAKEKNRDSLLQKTCEILIEARDYDATWLGLLKDGKTFAMVKGAGFGKNVNRFSEYVMKGDYPSCIKKAFTKKNPFVIIDKSKECGDCFFKSACVGKESAVIRVEYTSRLFGLLAVLFASDFVVNEEEKRLLNEVAGDIAFALHNIAIKQAHKKAQEDIKHGLGKLQRTLEETVNALASAVGQRDPYTASHQQRVTKLAVAITSEMDLPRNQVLGIRIVGLLHDIGKIAVPAEILSKPAQLTHAEFGIVKEHSKVGYDILKSIEFPWPVAEIILHHHERIDGSGYPQGLLGEDILLEAKILGVADVVEAMCSHRPYRPALGVDQALEYISQNKGSLFDPQVVDVCVRLFKEKGFRFE